MNPILIMLLGTIAIALLGSIIFAVKSYRYYRLSEFHRKQARYYGWLATLSPEELSNELKKKEKRHE